jgi:uncharacterized membrane protein
MPKVSELDRRTVTKNIESILKLEKEDEQRLSALHRLSHALGSFVGTVYFIVVQAAFVLLWILWNGYLATSFDPYPFPLLSAVLALETVFLTSFILIRQNAMDLRSERRNHLDLQINLLAEKETTTILKVLGQIADRLDIDMTRDAENRELTEDTPVEGIARDLRSKED